MRDARAEFGELLRIFEELHNLHQFFLFLIRTRHVAEQHLLPVLRGGLDLGSAERIELSAALSVHLVCRNDPQHDHEDHDQNHRQEREPCRNFGGRGQVVAFDLARLDQFLHVGGKVLVEKVQRFVVKLVGQRRLVRICKHDGQLIFCVQGNAFDFVRLGCILLARVADGFDDIVIGRLLRARSARGQRADCQNDQQDRNSVVNQLTDHTALLHEFLRSLPRYFSYTDGFSTPTYGRLRYFSS